MTEPCEHPVGYIPKTVVTAKHWNEKLLAFAAVIDDFNVRGQRDQISHPGFVQEAKFCALCGVKIDRVALGLLTYAEALAIHAATKGEGSAYTTTIAKDEPDGL